MEHFEKLKSLRELMEQQQLDACIIPITDPHIGEYVPDHWKCIEWLTGFSGSAGTVVVTSSFAGLWTDSRYFIQADEQLKGTGFQLIKLKVPHTPEFIDWLHTNLSSGKRVGYDGKVVPIELHRKICSKLESKGIEVDSQTDLISPLWKNRPPLPDTKIFEHEVKFAGCTREEKINDIRKKLAETGSDYHLLAALDDIAWTFNLRAGDVRYSPLFISYALIGMNDAYLFVHREKLPESLHRQLTGQGMTILPYMEITDILQNLPDGATICLSPGTVNCWIYHSIPDRISIKEGMSLPVRLKAVKNQTEIGHIRKVMVKDGVALTRFFIWLENTMGTEKITEVSASQKLAAFRAEQKYYRGDSFATIAAYGPHGASPHYEPTPESDVELKPEGIFLLDSGGQYLDGTTDVTRTIALNKPSAQQKRDFTLALKGTINLAMVRFPEGTKGYQIEILARKALWDNALNYGHGTGHGVGFFLNVHEGPQTIGTAASGNMGVSLEPGMLTSDEPAIYREGAYGIRTENLMLCIPGAKSAYGQFLEFETVTLCFIDSSLIEKSLMTDEETRWINDYHKRVYDKLSPELSEEEQRWLKEKIKPI